MQRWTTGCLAKIAEGPAGDAEYTAVLATVPRTTAPQRIADFGYEYDAEGRLVQSLSKKPFAWLGQKHYDCLGDAVINDVYAMLEAKYGLYRISCPVDAELGEPTVPIFASRNWEEAPVLVVLCQGSGAVRPGMWARALCMNDTLQVGTIFTYLDQILQRGWGVLVLNPNENFSTPPSAPPQALSDEEAFEFWLSTADAQWKQMASRRLREGVAIRESETPQDHMLYAWDTMVSRANARDVLIIAHSYGGRCTTALVEARTENVERRVKAIALTDAINDMFKMTTGASAAAKKRWRGIMAAKSVNWIASDEPLDTDCGDTHGAREVSSGHTKHEWTSASCCGSVFRFLDAAIATSKAV